MSPRPVKNEIFTLRHHTVNLRYLKTQKNLLNNDRRNTI